MGEKRVSDWVRVDGRADWKGSGVVAYRIWQEFDGRSMWQAHQWEQVGGKLHMDPWFQSSPGSTWTPSAHTEEEAPKVGPEGGW
jgi:hypothetical protein